MRIVGKVKKEKADFAKLYEGIKNDVVKERIKTSGEWYIENAAKYKCYFFALSIIGIAAPLVVTVLGSVGASKLNEANEIRIWTAVFSVVASFTSTMLVVSRCKEKWTNYRNAVERIKNALVWYSVDDEEDNEKLKKLVTRTERIMKDELNRWNEIAEMDDQKIEKKQDQDMKGIGEKAD